MKTVRSPSLNRSVGSNVVNINKKPILIIRNNYLKNIRKDLLEEKDNNVDDAINNEIAYVTVHINGIHTTAMIDTGANVSSIDKVELNRIQACLLYTSRCV